MTKKSKIAYITDFPEKIRIQTKKNVSHWLSSYPEFSDECFKNEKVNLALQQALGWSQFFCTYWSRDLSTAGKFFSKSPAHQMFFYSLLRTFSDSVVYRSSPQVGLPVSEALAQIEMTGASKTKARGFIREAVEAGYVIETYWRGDQRVKVLYLAPNCVKNWIKLCCEILYKSSQNLRDVRDQIDAEGDNFYSEVVIILEAAMKRDADNKK